MKLTIFNIYLLSLSLTHTLRVVQHMLLLDYFREEHEKTYQTFGADYIASGDKADALLHNWVGVGLSLFCIFVTLFYWTCCAFERVLGPIWCLLFSFGFFVFKLTMSVVF